MTRYHQKHHQKNTAENKQSFAGRMLMFKCFVVFWVVSFCSALGVVHSTFETRKATQELEELRREASSLTVVSGQYLLEQSSLGAYSRVEKIATNTLKMKVPGPEHTVLVNR